MNTASNSLSPKELSTKTQLIIGGLLLIAMILTRGNITAHLQDASWAIFFLVGFYLRGSSLSRLGFPLFFLAAFAIDLVVIDAQGGQHYCFTPAYPFLIPAYAAMWFAGHWFAKQYQENLKGFSTFAGAVLLATIACFFISNAGFYFFGGKFETMSIMEYASSVAQYLPGYLKTTLIYLSSAALIHLVISHSKVLGDKPAHY